MAQARPAAKPRDRSFRGGGKRLRIRNSGREVWLYDDASREKIRAAEALVVGGMGKGFDAVTGEGLLVGYSLLQDDDLDIEVHVGKPLQKAELAIARWLEPQRAFLRLPSGKLCVESNDASRIGPDEPAEKGGRVSLPAGRYRLTLYRIDHEALDREGLAWSGPEEVIVLTPGGSRAQAVRELLPFQERRDESWIGKVAISGRRANVLVWFGDGLDTFVVNLDRKATTKLGLSPGSYLRTHVPQAGVTLVSAFAASWKEAERLPLPAGVELGEYGFAAFSRLDDWDYVEALFCRRDRTETRIADAQRNVWLPGTIEVLEAGPSAARGRAFVATKLEGKDAYFDEGFLSLVLSEVLPAAGDADDIRLPKTLKMLDARMRKLGLSSQGDRAWQERRRSRSVDKENAARFYAGRRDLFAVALLSAGCFEILFLTESASGNWIVTGFADEIAARLDLDPKPRIDIRNLDEEDLGDILAAHEERLAEASAKPSPAPRSLAAAVAAFARFLAAALD